MKNHSLIARRRRIGSFEGVEVLPNDDSFDIDQNLTLLVFHGYGADAQDLASLAFEIKTQKPVHWLFLEAPLTVPIGPGWTGKAWWPIQMSTIATEDYSQLEPKELLTLRKQLSEVIQQLRKPKDKIIVGGFSQGGMLATDLFLDQTENLGGLIILSGTLIAQQSWQSKIAKRKGCHFFQSHGQNDPVLLYKNAQKLETFLTQNEMKGRLLSFSGGHEINSMVLQKMTEYIDTLIVK